MRAAKLKNRKRAYRARPSMAGRVVWNAGKKTGDQNRKKKLWLPRECAHCNNIFYSYPSSNRKYCSESCRSKHTRNGSVETMLEGLYKLYREKRSTSIERKLYRELRRLNISFAPQKKVDGKYKVDAFVPKHNLVIEADGVYWHSLPRVVKKDKEKNEYFLANGYNLLRLTEKEIKNGSFIEKLKQYV